MKKIQKKVLSAFRFRRKHVEEPTSDSEEQGLGARIPPELFFHILRWVSRNDDRRETFIRLRRKAGENPKKFDRFEFDREYEMAGPAYTLRSCSLVCLYWANQSREYMFRGARLYISTLQNAQFFRRYAIAGSPNLVPDCTLVRVIDVSVLCSKTKRSYLDLVYLPQTSNKLRELEIYGPLPKGIPPSMLDTPHWSITNLAPLPPSITAYQAVKIRHIDFPSFRHLVKYFKYFNAATDYYLENITWDGKTPSTLSHFTKPATRHRQSITVRAQLCTDGLLLCLQVAMMYQDFPLRTVASQDYVWALHLMDLVGDFYRQAPQTGERDKALIYCLSNSQEERPQHCVRLQMTQIPPNYVEVSLQFFSEQKSSPTSSVESGRTPPIRTRIVGLIIDVDSKADITDYTTLVTIDFSVLVKSVQQHSAQNALRVVVFAFSDYGLLQESTKRYPTLLEQTEGTVHILICQRSPKYPFSEVEEREVDRYNQLRSWIQIDHSLTVTGKQWPYIRGALYEALEPPIGRSLSE
ncbi:hypothetical protein BDY19DRAFT_8053 [Irpex rosettiformis]|uniref:Uncharacterized protein n=1 Tax=Irpex rosettiformis TaxID=378272 RepID=A0ACB8UIJ1_9APHY|nr:hypothetical protein BDY19DRAFT_8053 [Irpex rosettiformis]